MSNFSSERLLRFCTFSGEPLSLVQYRFPSRFSCGVSLVVAGQCKVAHVPPSFGFINCPSCVSRVISSLYESILDSFREPSDPLPFLVDFWRCFTSFLLCTFFSLSKKCAWSNFAVTLPLIFDESCSNSTCSIFAVKSSGACPSISLFS
jgi:hypothetical protein